MKAAIENSRNATIFTATTLAPLGSSKAKDAVIPITKHSTARAPEQITTDLKLRHRRMELSAGNTIRLDMSSAPIILMPSTTVTAVSTAMTLLYSLGLSIGILHHSLLKKLLGQARWHFPAFRCLVERTIKG